MIRPDDVALPASQIAKTIGYMRLKGSYPTTYNFVHVAAISVDFECETKSLNYYEFNIRQTRRDTAS